MAAGKYNFVIEQGTTLDLEVVYKDSNDNPIDLTDYQGRMQIKDTIGGSSLANDGTGLDFGGSNGTIGIFISANSSSALDFNKAAYDLEIASGSTYPVVTRILQGSVTLDKEVTTGEY